MNGIPDLMADISLTAPSKSRSAAEPGDPAVETREPYWDLIELLFFAYRDFVGDPDQVLERLGFGRAHHRVLHFVNRNPGMKVAELLDVLKITKQSLGRVLKQLIDEGYVVQREGADRRGRSAGTEACGHADRAHRARRRRAGTRRPRYGAAFPRRHDRSGGPRTGP